MAREARMRLMNLIKQLVLQELYLTFPKIFLLRYKPLLKSLTN